MATYTEVKFKRIEEQEPDRLTITFQRINVIKTTTLTKAEADILNAGKTTDPGNIEFTLLIAEGESDPQAIVHALQKAAPGGRVNDKGELVLQGEAFNKPNRAGHTGRGK